MTWRVVAPLCAAIAIVVLAAILLGSNHGTTIDPIAQAADTTAATGSAEFGLAGSITAAGQNIPLSGNGAVDMRSHSARMSMSMPIPGVGSTQIEELISGTVFYIHFPAALASRLPGGKAWMKLDLQSLKGSSGVDFKKAMEANQQNPADMLQALKGVGSSKVVGHENLGNVPTTHYAAKIDLDKAAEKIGDKQTVAALKQQFAASGVKTIPIEVWIDRAKRVRQERVNMSLPDGAVDMTITFTKFGVPVETTPPPADQVMDASALLGGLGSGS